MSQTVNFPDISKNRDFWIKILKYWPTYNGPKDVTDLSESKFKVLLFEFQIDAFYTKDGQLKYSIPVHSRPFKIFCFQKLYFVCERKTGSESKTEMVISKYFSVKSKKWAVKRNHDRSHQNERSGQKWTLLRFNLGVPKYTAIPFN